MPLCRENRIHEIAMLEAIGLFPLVITKTPNCQNQESCSDLPSLDPPNQTQTTSPPLHWAGRPNRLVLSSPGPFAYGSQSPSLNQFCSAFRSLQLSLPTRYLLRYIAPHSPRSLDSIHSSRARSVVQQGMGSLLGNFERTIAVDVEPRAADEEHDVVRKVENRGEGGEREEEKNDRP